MNLKKTRFNFYIYIICGFISDISFALSIGKLERSEENVNQLVKKFFPNENNLCVIQLELGDEEYFPKFHVPVVAYSRDQILQDCDGKLKDQDGYVLVTSNASDIEVHMVPILKCLNLTTLKIKTKYILILDSTEDRISYETYENHFDYLWKSFGIINLAVLAIRYQSGNSEPPFIMSFNPFFARQNSNASVLVKNTLDQDLRRSLTNRFRNMYGHSLRAVVARSPGNGITIEHARQVKSLGDNPVFLLKQSFEQYLNISFDVYEHLTTDEDPNSMDSKFNIPLGEIMKGKADYCVHFMFSTISWPKTIQLIQIGYSFRFIFVVPSPRQVESWRLFLYIFQWEVSVGLALTLVVLSVTSVLFVVVISKTNKLSDGLSVTSEVVLVLKAFISASINTLPTRHSQRLMVAMSLVLGLVSTTVFSAKLFNLIKSRPTEGHIGSLHELLVSKLPIHITHRAFETILDTFENTSLTQLRLNVKYNKTLERDRNLLDPQNLNISGHAVLYIDDILYAIINSQPKNRVFLKYFDVIRESISEASPVAVYPIGSVFFDVFNELNMKLVAGGFYLYWYKVNNHKIVERVSKLLTSNAEQAQDHTSEDSPVSLKYDDLNLAFYILYIGLTMSALCFIKEIISKKN